MLYKRWLQPQSGQVSCAVLVPGDGDGGGGWRVERDCRILQDPREVRACYFILFYSSCFTLSLLSGLPYVQLRCIGIIPTESTHASMPLYFAVHYIEYKHF